MDIISIYEAQGYELPEGVTRAMVTEHRARFDIDPVFVPVASVDGICAAWGVPFVDGQPLKHEPTDTVGASAWFRHHS